MAHVQVHDDVSLDEPTLVEGLPGVGLVGKIAADHLVETRDMHHFASVHCDGLPDLAVYQAEEAGIQAPVRLYRETATDLLVLQSDVPVSPEAADEFAGCVTRWLDDRDATPVYLSGRPTEKDGMPTLWGVATGDGEVALDSIDVDPPAESGAVSGPTGALLYEAERTGLGSVGLVVEADPQFPDPEAARVLLVDGVAPLTDIDVETDRLVEQADEISQAKAKLAERMRSASDESSQAQPLGMYQ